MTSAPNITTQTQKSPKKAITSRKEQKQPSETSLPPLQHPILCKATHKTYDRAIIAKKIEKEIRPSTWRSTTHKKAKPTHTQYYTHFPPTQELRAT
jgi:hypothetical protein